ncbi:MAG: CHASE2 domain-containing protein [Bacteroidota bacterium]|nr:CHASE2 domain-containing protein [Bacteroidota bacterium]
MKQKISPWFTRFAISTAITLLIITFVSDAFFHFGFFDRTKLSFIDRDFATRGPLPIPQDSLGVVLVTFSDQTDNSLPEHFPYPRSYYAHAIQNLNRAGVRAIGIDLTFELADKKGAAEDKALFNAIRRYKDVVVAGKTDIRSDEASIRRQNEDFHSIFYSADSSVGIVYVPNDQDGIYRRYWPLAKVPGEERYIPTFAFALYNKYLNLPSTTTCKDTTGAFFIGSHRIPKYDDVSMLINYVGPAQQTYRKIDFADILDDKTFKTKEELQLGVDINTFDDPDIGWLQTGILKNKIVIIGPAFPESKDIFPVSIAKPEHPDENLMYGMEIHANALQTLLSGDFIVALPLKERVLIVWLFSLLTFLVVSVLKHLKWKRSYLLEVAAVLFIGIEIYAVLYFSHYFFAAHRLLMPVVSPIAAVLANYVGSAVYQYLTERKQKVMIKGMFSQYLNPTVVDELIAHPEKLRLGGERRELTVLFSDIAGFTTFSEKLPPEELVLVLNEYLSAMTEIVFNNDGTLDKYEGDAVMAFWGAPVELDNNALHACNAALEMQERLVAIREKWKGEGKPDVYVRIGLNTGEMVVGNMGGTGRFDYTVIGDSVNLGSRLEGANKQYGTYIMASERTRDMVEDFFIFRELDLLIVKGKTKPIKVFELVGKKSDSVDRQKLDAIEEYAKGLALYRQKRFEEAIGQFRKALSVNPDDQPSKIYIERSQLYLAAPPPDDWNGVFVLKTK